MVNIGEDGYRSVQYSHLVPVLIEALKEQQAIIDEQQQAICEQNARIVDLQGQSADIEKMKAQLEYLMNSVQQYEATK